MNYNVMKFYEIIKESYTAEKSISYFNTVVRGTKKAEAAYSVLLAYAKSNHEAMYVGKKIVVVLNEVAEDGKFIKEIKRETVTGYNLY